MEDCLSDDLNKFRQMEPELFNIIKQKDGFKEVILLSIREIYIYICSYHPKHEQGSYYIYRVSLYEINPEHIYYISQTEEQL